MSDLEKRVEALRAQWEREIGIAPQGETWHSYWSGRLDALNDLRALLENAMNQDKAPCEEEPPDPDLNADGPAERAHRQDEARRMK